MMMSEKHAPPGESHRFTLYKRRWLVLVSFSFLSMTSSWIWITWSPIHHLISTFWDVSEGEVDALSGVYMYVFVPGSFLSLYIVVNHIGLRWGLVTGALLNVLGSIIRFLGRTRYECVYMGTFLCACAQSFTLATPPLLAGKWFGAEERATATSLGVLANQFGTFLGLGATVIIDFQDYDREQPVIDSKILRRYLFIQMAATILALICVLLFVNTDDPPTPPSAAAFLKTQARQKFDNGSFLPTNLDTFHFSPSSLENIDEEKPLISKHESTNMEQSKLRHQFTENKHISDITSQSSYLGSIKIVLLNKSNLLFVLVFGLIVGVYYTIPTFISQFVPLWTSRQSGWLGILYQLSGVFGSLFLGRALDIYQNHRIFILVLLFGSILAMGIFWVFINLSFIPSTYYYATTYFSVACTGFCLAALNAIGLEYGTAITYPADEAAVSGVLECAAELGGFLLVTIGSRSDVNIVTTFSFILICAVSVSFFLFWCNRTVSKRPN